MMSIVLPYSHIEIDNALRMVHCSIPTGASISWTIRDGKGKLVKFGVSEYESSRLSIDCSGLDYWSPESPNLYELELLDGDDVIARKTLSFSAYSTLDDKILLNGQPIYIRGYIRGLKAHEHDNFCFRDIRDYYEKNVRMAKEYGFNYVRWHSTIPDEEFLFVADELGMLVHVEFSFEAVWAVGPKGERYVKDVKFDRQHVMDTIEKVCAHPSVVVICLGNEIRCVGKKSTVTDLASEIKLLAPQKIILDTCGWGEYDRESTDIFCQHMGYYFPFGKHRNMFNILDIFALDGSVNEEAASDISPAPPISVSKPMVAHEVVHYISWPDTEKMERDLADPLLNVNKIPNPWWLDELKNLEQTKGIIGDKRQRAISASNRFCEICTREALERIRMSPILQGYMMLQFADTNHYENRNGIVDFFDNPKFISSRDLRRINADLVIMADLNTRCFVANTEQSFDVWLSDYSNGAQSCSGELNVRISGDAAILQEQCLKNVQLNIKGVHKLGSITMMLPDVDKPRRLSLDLVLTTDAGNRIENSYDIWCFPSDKQMLKTDIQSPKQRTEGNVIISHYLDENLLQDVINGEKVFLLYNPIMQPCPPSSYYMPFVEDHWKPVIWDRGHQMGGIVQDSPVLGDYPHDGCLDFQFANLVEGAVKINLDRILDHVDPIVEGLDRPVRDRIMVMQGKVTDFDHNYYMRRMGYVFELNIGLGTLLVCTFNLVDDSPESRHIYTQMLEYFKCAPAGSGKQISESDFRAFLNSAPDGGRIRETPQNEYWQRDDEPVESLLFWEELGVDITKI